MLTVGSLFAGIGGLDLGLERAGMKTIWQSEIDPYASQVLKKHWPEVPNYGDIKEIKWSDVQRPDVICGGYPCQPFSTAGKRQGENDPRHLWPWVRECISVLRPRYAILENVRGHLSLGGTTVLGEIAELGYCAEWRVISAASVGAAHRRDRIIIVAYPDDTGSRTPQRDMDSGGQELSEGTQKRRERSLYGFSGRGSEMADSASEGLQGPVREVYQGTREGLTYGGGEWWQTEPDVGRVADGVPRRVDRLKCLGNAVVPQVAEVIGHLVRIHANDY
jgi:DNA (cytosine-5)-methyltransferase 1